MDNSISRLTTMLLCYVLAVSAMNAPDLAFGADKSVAGSIKGRVNYCGNGGYIGMQVFIPGRQFSVLLGSDGNFIFEKVPAGSYEIDYVINGKLVNVNKNVGVFGGDTVDIGEIAFCAEQVNRNQANTSTTQSPSTATPSAPANPAASATATSAATSAATVNNNDCANNANLPECLDEDKDGVTAKFDCNDHDPMVHPGAIERCDGIDNNCNGKIDERVTVNVGNGTGMCNQGKVEVQSCHKGFGDCDKKPENGCETDLMKDNANCGACNHACSGVEQCALGSC